MASPDQRRDSKPAGLVRKPSETPTTETVRVSSVKVLNTSLPYIHEELLRLRKNAKDRGSDPDKSIAESGDTKTGSTNENEPAIPEVSIDPTTNKPRTRSKEEQEATARALKPHSRSTIALNELRKDKPESMTPVPPTKEKTKGKRWQFGIRSRNAPYEAMKCLYAAISAQDGDWEVTPALASDIVDEGKENVPPPPPEEEVEPGQPHKILQSRYPHLPSDYFVPRDPWFIRARMLKRGLYAPGVAPSLSRSNSQTNVKAEELQKRVSEMGGYISEDLQHSMSPNASQPTTRPGSGDTSQSSVGAGYEQTAQRNTTSSISSHPSTLSQHSNVSTTSLTTPNPYIGIYVFVDIQLYMLESNNYMVDFKCDGYQNVVFVPEGSKYPSSSKASTRNTSAVTSPQSSRPTSGFDSATAHSNLTSPLSQSATPDTDSDTVTDDEETSGSNHLSRTNTRIYDPATGTNRDDHYGGAATTASSLSNVRYVNGVRGTWKTVSNRYRNREKEVTSAYPYLDVASDLIAQLAVTG